MEEPRQPESFSSCRNVSDMAYYVKNKVELCIQNYMSLEVTATYLEKTNRISKSVTRIVWEQLREENPQFFNHFEMRRQMALQMRKFNDMLTKQAVGMFENGLLDICDASPSVKALLRQQHPERVHLLETLASKTKQSSASLVAFPYANGPSGESFTDFAAQSQNPYDQQKQVLNSARLALSNPNCPPVTQFPIPYAQQDQHLYASSLPLPTANGPSMTQLPVPNNQQTQPHQDPLPTYDDLISPTFAPAADTDDWSLLIDPAAFDDLADLPPLPPADTIQWPSPYDLAYTATLSEQDLSTFDLGGDIGHNGPSFLDAADTILAGMDFNEQQQYQPHWQQQQQQNNQVPGSNGLENGGITDTLFCNNFDIMHTSVHQQQTRGGVEGRHHPESEALNNPDTTGVIGHNAPSDSDIKSAARLVMQHSEQTQHQNGHYQPQQTVPVEAHECGGRSNGVVDGESNGHQFCNNFDKDHSKRVCTSVDQQQAGRVKRHHPESEALNNPN